MVTIRSPFRFDQPALIVFATEEQIKSDNLSVKDKQVKAALKAAVDAGQFAGKKTQAFPAVVGKKLVLFAGLGKAKDLTPCFLRMHVRRAAMSPFLKDASGVEIVPHEDTTETVIGVIEGLIIGTYVWKKYITPSKESRDVRKNWFIMARPLDVYKRVMLVAENVNFARDLINDNADVVHALEMEKVFKSVGRSSNVRFEVLDRQKLKAKKLGLVLAVNQGSNKEPRVLIAKYTGAGAKAPYTAIVGKGVTFDSGGLNLKPTGHIETMRSDMSGAAAVIALLKTAVELKVKKNLIFAAGIVENAIDSGAFKPGDVFRSYSGKTVEIGNTDAEGRLVLADVLAYVIKNYGPEKVIDLATLTGAVVVALAHDHAGLISNNDKLAEELYTCGQATNDRLWRLPNYPELRDCMKSKVADIKNTSNWRGAGGTITGGEFIRQFVGDVAWAHIDIAGVAFVDGDSHRYHGHGGTGAGIRLLSEYLFKS